MSKFINRLMKIIGLVAFIAFASACEDSLGIEDSVSKTLVSGKALAEVSYKEYAYIINDTLMVVDTLNYADTTWVVVRDTIKIPVYDTVSTNSKHPEHGVLTYFNGEQTYNKYYLTLTPYMYPELENMKITYKYGLEYLTAQFNVSFDKVPYGWANNFPYLPDSIYVSLKDCLISPLNTISLAGDKHSGNYAYATYYNADKYTKIERFGESSDMIFQISEVFRRTDGNKFLVLFRCDLLYGWNNRISPDIDYNLSFYIACY